MSGQVAGADVAQEDEKRTAKMSGQVATTIYGVDAKTGVDIWRIVDPLAEDMRRSRSEVLRLIVMWFAWRWSEPAGKLDLDAMAEALIRHELEMRQQ
jgi:hypothetical protein